MSDLPKPYYDIWAPDLSGPLQGAGGVGGLVAVSIDGVFYFPCYDNLGNIVAYVDESGVTVASYTYDAFGYTLSSSGTKQGYFPHRFSTKYRDEFSGFYDYGYRWYWPEYGRWLNRDPIEEEGGENLYVANRNSCLDGFDPVGLWKIADDSYGNNISVRTGKARLVYRKESGDTLDSLAEKVGLSVSDMEYWVRFSESQTPQTTKMLIDTGGWNSYCYASVPNVWIDADFLRGGGPYSRIVNIGGTLGSFFATDIAISSKHKVVTVDTPQELLTAVATYQGDLWGIQVFAHGAPNGYLGMPGEWNRSNENINWVKAQTIASRIGLGNYKLAQIRMEQCYGGNKDNGLLQLWGARANEFHGYSGINALGFDLGWKIFPWNWF